MKNGRGWAWAIHDKGSWQLCNFAEAYPEFLRDGGKPSPEAKLVHVRISKLVRVAKRGKR